MVVVGVGLFFGVAGFSHSQTLPQGQQASPQDNVAGQAMSSSSSWSNSSAGNQEYGGTPAMKMQSGGRHMKPCSYDPQCNVFFGGS
jgi:hypothetical protein